MVQTFNATFRVVLEVLQGAGPQALLPMLLVLLGVPFSIWRHRANPGALGAALIRLSAAVLLLSLVNAGWGWTNCQNAAHVWDKLYPRTESGFDELCRGEARGNLVVGASLASPILSAGARLALRGRRGALPLALGMAALAFALAGWERAVQLAETAGAWLP